VMAKPLIMVVSSRLLCCGLLRLVLSCMERLLVAA